MTRRRAVLIALSLSSACAGSKPDLKAGADDACADFELSVKKTWNDQTKVELRGSLMDTWSGELGVDAARTQVNQVEASLDQLAQDWVMLRRAACRDYYARHIGTAEQYQQAVGCFDRVLQRQRSTVLGLKAGSPDALASVATLDSELSVCKQ